jgi:sigma-B regulation protein RsbU (phosphoserine phosphatase)
MTGTVQLEKPSPVANNQSRPLLLYSILTLVALMSFAYQTRVAQDVIYEVLHPTEQPREPFQMSSDHFTVKSVSPEAEAAGLWTGDRVVILGHSGISGFNDMYRKLSKMRPGEEMHVAAMRGGRTLSFDIRLARSREQFHPLAETAIGLTLGVLMPWFSVLLGVYIASVRVRDPLAWIVLGVMLSFTGLVNTTTYLWGNWIRIPGELFHTLLATLWPTFMFLFGYYFPARLTIDRRWPWLKWILVGPLVLFAVVTTPLSVGALENLPSVQPYVSRLHFLQGIHLGLAVSAITLGLFFLGWKAFRTSNKDARRRMRLLFSGMFVSLAPILTLISYTAIRNVDFEALSLYITIPSILLIVLFPLTLAYVILVNRAMDVSVVLRQSLQYAFARSGVVVLRVLTLAIFGVTGYWLATAYARNLGAQVILALVLIGAVLAVNVTMRRLGLWVDRRFFRDQYDAERILSELSDQVSRIREPQPLAETVSDRIAGALHVSRVAFVLENNGNFETCHLHGFESNPHIHFPNNCGLIKHLNRSKEPQRVYFDDESSWLYRAPDMDDEQRSRLAYLGTELLLPLATRDHLLGFISAGQKRSEEPYSKSDVRMLSSVANQAGLALENAKLTTAIASEMAQRERLAREVEIAREVQERLFPQTLPPIQGLDYAGFCRTALGVGGDYYDFLALPGHQLGFAVGDVAGKGISAALLMASLQASLRGETSHGTTDLSGLIGNLNKRVFEASTSNRYATFFYGQYTPETHRVDYVNAGHNPPILVRRNGAGWDVSELSATGTVVGLIMSSEYDQASVELSPGDYLVAFTDGISEAMNHDDDEWGEERLTETIRACAEASLTAKETVKRILSAADTFVAGAKQHDDMTVVVLRVQA